MDTLPPKRTFPKGYKQNLTETGRESRSSHSREQMLRKHQAACDAYDANPNTCQYCGRPILRRTEIPLHRTKIRKFCNNSCAASYNNPFVDRAIFSHEEQLEKQRLRRRKTPRCKECNKELSVRYRHLCDDCLTAYFTRSSARTKGEVGRGAITSHARHSINGRPKVCARCGWNHFVQVAHIQPISSFPLTATLAEINAPGNLQYLCPNCHWDYDHPRKGRLPE